MSSLPAVRAATPSLGPDPGARVTPMMEQYIEIKAANPDCLLFYRMGDFYELFFDDAETASRALGIALTKRGKHLGQDIPMCGVPVERSDDYLHRLIAAGHRVAVCEQTEDPAEARKRGGKSVVRRDVVRLVTPGTLTEDNLLEARRNNYLLAVCHVRAATDAKAFGLAWVDISTGEFGVAERDRLGLQSEIARLDPGEIIVSDALYADAELVPFWRTLAAITPLARDVFDSATAERRLAHYFAVATTAAFGPMSRAEHSAAAACVTYIERTQLGKRPPLSIPSRQSAEAVLQIDAATRSNLELLTTLSGEYRGSVLSSIDRTQTAAGSRLLMQRLAAPLTDRHAVGERLDTVLAFVDDASMRKTVRDLLRAAPDLARALSRIVLGRGSPRDLAAVRDGLFAARAIAERLSPEARASVEIKTIHAGLNLPDSAVADRLAAALADELPPQKRDGGFIRANYAPDLDEARRLRDESRRVIASMQGDYVEETGIRGLRIRHNNVLGYFIEVTAQHADKLLAPPLNARFIHRQTLAGQVRFTTVALGELETRIASAADRALCLELELFERLVTDVTASGNAIKGAADALAALDVTAGLAALATEHNYVRPQITDGIEFHVESGRHPVVEQALRREAVPFVANDCDLSGSGEIVAGRIWMLTGPNMAGKSTFLRQNALIAILAQMGSFVPAKHARLGIVDRLFSRVGAADDLARGRSTFMVEMVETAAILNQATPRSLVILDEIGRGTSTFDGLSIAWATVEHLHDVNRCRALFATHFHELTALSARLPRLFNATVRVKEWQGDVVFLHEVVPGAADRSYGVAVAKLAGLPTAVIARAQHVLAQLEAEDRASPRARLIDDLPLFAAAARAAEPAAKEDAAQAGLIAALGAIHPDELSPREALEALYMLKAKAAGKS